MKTQNNSTEYKNLLIQKQKLIRKLVISNYDTTEDIQIKCPEFYESVVNEIRILGSITENEGHSEIMDEKKNRLYALIRL